MAEFNEFFFTIGWCTDSDDPDSGEFTLSWYTVEDECPTVDDDNWDEPYCAYESEIESIGKDESEVIARVEREIDSQLEKIERANYENGPPGLGYEDGTVEAILLHYDPSTSRFQMTLYSHVIEGGCPRWYEDRDAGESVAELKEHVRAVLVPYLARVRP